MTDDRPPLRATIRNVVIHLTNEQPLLADLFEVPAPGDLGLRCTNLRTMSGKRPVFADNVASIYFFPYHNIRFVEIHPTSEEQALLEAPTAAAAAAAEEAANADLEIDEEFLRRIREV